MISCGFEVRWCCRREGRPDDGLRNLYGKIVRQDFWHWTPKSKMSGLLRYCVFLHISLEMLNRNLILIYLKINAPV